MRENFGFLVVVIKLEARAASGKFLTAAGSSVKPKSRSK
jgi:hypothetical protein